MNLNVLFSVFKRNFFGYLANPTGYVFICVFMLLGSIAAFLPDAFFNANLANLDQLNLWFPLIMLVFVPAITMGIWADERRQGTDELLLTIPAGDVDIVLGKYLAALGIFSASLVFSLICNLAVLRYLGQPDVGLFLCTYFGYWLVGVFMIATGMVASFCTANLTMAYIFGAAFCVPSIALQWVEQTPLPQNVAAFFKMFSVSVQLEPFGRGMLSAASIIYFITMSATMLYLSMVLIGKRHWSAHRRRLGTPHYFLRSSSLLVISLALCFFFRNYNLRADMTEEKLSTLAPETVELLQRLVSHDLEGDQGVVIEAFLSPDVPESYVQTRLNILSVLNEIEAICGKKVMIRIHGAIQPNTEEAHRVAQRYNIRAREVVYESRGQRGYKRIFMGISFRCGLRNLSLPFIDLGLSAEYEIIHALSSVTTTEKKRIGILKTDAALFGFWDADNFRFEPPWQIVTELQKQYDIAEVDAMEPIKERYDALLAVQPSAMSPIETENFIKAVKAGQPTVIFEDPYPGNKMGIVPGTAMQRFLPSNLQRGLAQPKGVIAPLWDFLGLEFDANTVVWQEYLPIRLVPLQGFVFLDRSQDNQRGVAKPFCDSNLGDSAPILNQLQYLMLPCPGRVAKRVASKNTANNPASGKTNAQSLTVTTLLQTFQHPAGTMSAREVVKILQSQDNQTSTAWYRDGKVLSEPIPLAVRVQGEVPLQEDNLMMEPRIFTPDDVSNEEKRVNIDVMVVADIDLLTDELFMLRRRGNEVDGVNLNFDNVNFVLNAIDSVAGDARFLSIRCRRPKHRTLARFDKDSEAIRAQTMADIAQLKQIFEKEIEPHQKEFAAIQQARRVSSAAQEQELNATERTLAKKHALTLAKAQRELAQKIEQAEVTLNERIQAIEGQYKLLAVALPPLPPLLVGGIVMRVRRSRERESVPVSRRRKIALRG